jgi:Uma2 family endonuclease
MSAIIVPTNQISSQWRAFGKFMRLEVGNAFKKEPDEKLEEMRALNPDCRIERNANGDIIVRPPVYTETGGRNFTLAGELFVWAKIDGTGQGFDSSTGFTLPNGAIRSPDVAWVSLTRLNALPPEKRQRFARIAPDFVVELRSSSDSLKDLQDKMREYIANGVRLGWLIDTKRKRAYIYRPGRAVEALTNPATLSGEGILPDFVLNMHEIWG